MNLDSPGDMRFTKYLPDAPHRATVISHTQYLQSLLAEGSEPSHIFRCPGVQLEHAAVDSMHAGDLGVFADALGSVFWCEVTNKQWRRNTAAGLVWLNQQLWAHYSANADQKLSMLQVKASQLRSSKDGGYPTLKAKAAQARHVAQFALVLAQLHVYGSAGKPAYAFRANSRLGPHSADHRRLILQVFEGMVQYHSACSATPFDPAECKAGVYRFLQGMEDLRVLWRQGLVSPDSHNHLPWTRRPKGHLMQHLVEDQLSLWGSPSNYWCYSDESFIGCLKLVTAASKHPATLEKTVSDKCMILAGVEAYLLRHP